MKRGLYALLFVAGFALAGGAAVVVAETTTTSSTTSASTTAPTTTVTTTTTPTATTTPPTTTTPTTTTPTTTRPTTQHPALIPARVRIAGVDVGGLDVPSAAAAVRRAFARPLTVVVDRSRLQLDPTKLAAAYVTGAVARARASAPGARVNLVVAVRGKSVRGWTARLAKRYDREALDAKLMLRSGRPVISKDRAGRAFDAAAVTRRIVRALTANARTALKFRTTTVAPAVTRKGFGPVIVINRGANRLSLYDGTRPWRTFGVATGQSVYPTPRGSFQIVVKYRNPWWYPPTGSSWAKGLRPVPPGPGNPLGTRWMGLSAPGVGIHGTPDAASIGYSASHGCIRMLISNAEWLFEHVNIGTPVFIL